VLKVSVCAIHNCYSYRYEKHVKMSFTKISKSNFIAYCALTFKFVHNRNYSNCYEIFKRD